MALFFISFVLSLVPKCVFFSLALALGEGCDGCDGFDTFTLSLACGRRVGFGLGEEPRKWVPFD